MRIRRIVFMNAPILTAEGVWTYRMIGNADNARVFLAEETWDGEQGVDPIPRLSAVGHQSTAEAMTELLGEDVEVNRIDFRAEPGDACLIMKLRGRIPEGVTLDRKQLEEIGYDFAMMELALGIDLGGAEEEWIPSIRELVQHIAETHAVRFTGGCDDMGYHRKIQAAFGIALPPDLQKGYDKAMRIGWKKTGEAIAEYGTW